MTFDARKEYFETLAATGLLMLILVFDQKDQKIRSFIFLKPGKNEINFVYPVVPSL
jgi:hypothetical protein